MPMQGDAGLEPTENDDDVAALLRHAGLPLDEAQIAELRRGYKHIQQLRAMLQRPVSLDTDLAVAFLPDFD